MKILRLDISNIASIEESSIDFTACPLATEKLFLICGETGAGKSTILNCICLALYDNTPALAEYGGNSRDINGMTTKNTSQLLRRGANTGQVTLLFEGNDGNQYKAVWAARRIKKRDKSLQITTKRALYKMPGDVAMDSLNIIEELTGLSFSQFTRTTILAQGQFTKFLLADDNGKAEILEKLTGTEVYATIGERIYNICKEKTDRVKMLTEVLANSNILSAEQKKELEDQLPELRGKIINLTRSLKQLDEKIKWLKDEATYSQRLAENQAQQAEAQKATESEENQKDKQTIKIWEDTKAIRALMDEARAQQRQLDAAIESKPQLAEKYSQLLGGLDWLADEKNRLSTEARELDKSINDRKSRAEMYAHAGQIEILASSAEKHIADEAAAKKKYAEIQKDITTQQSNLKTLATAKATADAEFKASQDNLEKKSEKVKFFNIQELTEKSEQVRDLLSNLNAASTALEQLRKAASESENASQALADAQAEHDKQQRAENQWAGLVPERQMFYKEKCAVRDGMMEVKDHIDAMRSQFSHTHECPLCGSKDVELATDTIIDQRLKQAQEEAQKAKNALDEANTNVAKAHAAVGTLAKDIKQKQSTLKSAVESQKKADEEAQKKASAVGIDYKSAEAQALIDVKTEAANQQKLKLADQIKEANSALKAEKEAREAMEKARERKEKAQKAIDSKEKEIQQLTSKFDTQQELQTKARQGLEEDSKGLAELLFAGYAVEDGKYRALSNRISKEAADYESDKQALTKKNEDLISVDLRLSEAQAAISPLHAQYPEVQAAAKCQIPELTNAISALISEAANLDGKIKSLQDGIGKNRHSQDEYFNNPDNCSLEQAIDVDKIPNAEITDIKGNIKKRDDAFLLAKAACKEIEQLLANHQQIRPQLEENDNAETLATAHAEAETQRDAVNSEIVAIETKLKDDQEQAQKLVAQMAEKEALQAECVSWSKLENLFGGAKGQKFRKMAQCYVLRTLLQKANEYLAMLTHRYELCCADDSLVINVIDKDQGNTCRAVNMVSGGESFIISLALALGLSAISKDRLDVDTLFIDEGFGSLDNNTLETVISTLDRLHDITGGGRRVGIISHVSSLSERIPTQIQLLRTGPSSSRAVVVSL